MGIKEVKELRIMRPKVKRKRERGKEGKRMIGREK